MSSERSAMMKFGIWGAAIGAALVMVVGFTVGGWMTTTTAEKLSTEAVLASRTSVCVGQFMKGSNHETDLKAFKETDSWKRREFIEKGGWDKMPGEDTAHNYVSRACAEGIENLLEM